MLHICINANTTPAHEAVTSVMPYEGTIWEWVNTTGKLMHYEQHAFSGCIDCRKRYKAIRIQVLRGLCEDII